MLYQPSILFAQFDPKGKGSTLVTKFGRNSAGDRLPTSSTSCHISLV
jgi:hypothetical protein